MTKTDLDYLLETATPREKLLLLLVKDLQNRVAELESSRQDDGK